MKFILSFISLAVGSAFAQIYFPWWTMAIVCFLIGGIVGMNGIKSFFTGFLAIGLLWAGYAFYLDYNSIGALTEKMVALFNNTIPLNNHTLMLLTGLIGGLVGGMSCMTGSLGRWIFK